MLNQLLFWGSDVAVINLFIFSITVFFISPSFELLKFDNKMYIKVIAIELLCSVFLLESYKQNKSLSLFTSIRLPINSQCQPQDIISAYSHVLCPAVGLLRISFLQIVPEDWQKQRWCRKSLTFWYENEFMFFKFVMIYSLSILTISLFTLMSLKSNSNVWHKSKKSFCNELIPF